MEIFERWDFANMIWLNIEGYNGTYQISENGTVRRVLDDEDSHIIKPGKARNGAATITLWKDNIRSCRMLHKIYAETFQVSEEDAIQVIFQSTGLDGLLKAKYNLRNWCLEKIYDCEQESKSGNDMSIEISYLKQFMKKI